MQTKILKNNNTYHIFKHDGIADSLPVGVYDFQFGPMGMISLEKQEDIILPSKVYSNDKNFILHVQKSFANMDSGLLGVALVGGKGLGKSFTANILAKETNLPVIRLTGNVSNNSFTDYLKQLDQDYVLFIDEFEKIFPTSFNQDDHRVSQEELLSFLDNGTGRKNKILFLITSNSEYKISDYFKNRPSRLRYFKTYEYLEENVIREVIDDLLENRDYLEDLLNNLPYKDLNLDALIKIISEVNNHNMPYSKFKSFLNFKENKDLDISVSIKLEDGSLEEIGTIKNTLYPDNRFGVSKKILKGKNTAITLSYNEVSIVENPLSVTTVEGYYYDTKQKDQDGDYLEIPIEVILTPSVVSLASKYAF